MNKKRFILALLVLSVGSSGCWSRLVRTEREKVAKDWCATIRASQVIPVYPLSEDLRPGDVFLVTTSVHRQAKLYKDKGFLPLDQLTTRLATTEEYKSFYADSFLEGYAKGIPYARSNSTPPDAQAGLTDANSPGRTANASDANDASADAGAKDGRKTTDAFGLAPIPAAHFPTYTFDVERNQGLRLALPIQGIPVALGMLRTDRATGSVIIRNAYSYALPCDVLLPRLNHWANDPVMRSELRRLKKSVGKNSIYLRVVNRVYLVGGVDVMLTSNRAGSGGVDAGAAQKIDLVDSSTSDLRDLKTKAELLRDVQSTLAQSLTEVAKDAAGNVLPGGSGRIAFATSRQVQLQQDFERLLALGYLGFDVEILEDGRLGPLVSTFYRLQNAVPKLQPSQDLPPSVAAWSRLAIKSINVALTNLKGAIEEGTAPSGLTQADEERVLDLTKRLDNLVTHLPRHYPVEVYHQTNSVKSSHVEAMRFDLNDPVPRASFDSVISYWDTIDASLGAIKRAIDSKRPMQIQDGPPVTLAKLDALRTDTERELQKLHKSLNADPAIAEAADFWYHRILTQE